MLRSPPDPCPNRPPKPLYWAPWNVNGKLGTLTSAANGRPDSAVKIPLRLHPLTRPLTTRFSVVDSGRFQIPLTTRRWRWSVDAGARFELRANWFCTEDPPKGDSEPLPLPSAAPEPERFSALASVYATFS